MSAKINLRVDDSLWESFKSIVPRNISLNDAVVELIKREVQHAQVDS